MVAQVDLVGLEAVGTADRVQLGRRGLDVEHMLQHSVRKHKIGGIILIKSVQTT
jgi:hypothetical protein